MSDINVESIKGQLEEQDMKWLYNPPAASHFGCAYERKIGSVRRVLEGCL